MKTAVTKENLTGLVASLARRGPVVFLESQSGDHPAGRKSYIAAMPDEELKGYGREIVYSNGEEKRRWRENPWEALRRFHTDSGGWLFGYAGYEMKNHLEALTSANPDPVGAPDLYFMTPGLLVEIEQDRISILKGEIPGNALAGERERDSFIIEDFGPVLSERAYTEKIRDAQYRIREGDFYEINLSHQMQGVFGGDPLALYEGMRQRGPVPFGAYLSFGEVSVCCASPERFLAKRGDRIFSQPIKGTVHRGTTAAEDEKLMNWLRSSEKNRAENLMIVDLVRNDLGRVARTGSVKTTGLFEIQSFGTVHQMVSTVEAEAGEYHPVDIVKACFPMGSMTGAPKISAMRSIEELEETARGIYSGTIGYFTPGGDFDFNVVIRTAIIKGDKLFYSTGGAITSDSEPRNEWEETLTKAKALTDVDKAGMRTL